VRLGECRASVVWAVAVLAYMMAVFNRSSLSVAGIEASERFGIGASTLGLFTVLQLLVYAALQIPVGALLDRFGSRRMLVAGGLLMAAGQLVLGAAGSVWLALAARVMVGAGDAMTFISVLRIVAMWFAPRRNPLMVQLSGVLGQLGAFAAALPLVVLLHGAGWSATYQVAALSGLVVTGLVLSAVRDAPDAVRDGSRRPPGRGLQGELRLAWREPGTRLGLWTHFTVQFPGVVFALLWGYPFLTAGQGLSASAAGWLLSLLVPAAVVLGPLLAHLVARHPFHRSSMALGLVAATASVWTAVLLWPGRAPLWVLVVLVLTLALGGPGSMIGFDFARTFNPPERLGSATGIVNVGGFVASLVTIALIGLVIDVLRIDGSPAYTLDAFRWAFAVQYLIWGVGAVQVWRHRVRARRALAARDPRAFAALRAGTHIRPAEAG
jgi:sugar phosphate permease